MWHSAILRCFDRRVRTYTDLERLLANFRIPLPFNATPRWTQLLLKFVESENENLNNTTNQGTLCEQMHSPSANNRSDVQEYSCSRYRKEDWTNDYPHHFCARCAWTPFVSTEAVLFDSQRTKPYEIFEVDISLKSDGRISVIIGFTNIRTEPRRFTQED